MGYAVKWYVPGRVTVAHYWGDHTFEEMQASNSLSIENIRAGTAPVHLLLYSLDVKTMPRSFLPMMKEVERFRHEPNMGWTINVTHSGLLHLFGVLNSNVLKSPFAAVNTIEEANALLRKVDPTLADLLPEKWDASSAS
jgi:hypothetical protein